MGRSKKGLSDKVRKNQSQKKKNVFVVQKNPFEVKINKQKHAILGRKTKNDRGLPGVSRSKANKKRKDTLLKEYKERHKSNNLLDERFGEENAEIPVEEKMLMRFAIEKKKKHEKMSMFNLNDEEELTHFGRSLADIGDLGTAADSDDDDNGAISGDYAAEAHFGGGIFTKKSASENTEEKPMSRKEIMDEIILKSKKAKFERQSAQEQLINLTDKLDNTWEEVEALLKGTSKTKKDREEEKNAYKLDAYDIAVRQMQYDQKSTPAPKGKTEAELAADEVARVRRLQDERIQRMQEGHKNDEAARYRSADELNDDYVSEKISTEPVYYKDGIMVGAEIDTNDKDGDLQLDVEGDALEESVEHDNESADESEDDFSDIISGDEEVEGGQEDDSGEDDDSGNVSLDIDVRAHSKKADDFPMTYDEFNMLWKNRYRGDCVKCIIELLAKYRHAVGNKQKFKMLFQFAWKTICSLFEVEDPCLSRVNDLVSQLYDLCQLNVVGCAKYVIEVMQDIYHDCDCDGGKFKRLKLDQLIQFKLIKILFSTSDFFHPVCTPAMVIFCSILKSHQPASLKDLAYGLSVCTFVYEYVSFSKRFLPECINYLCACMCFFIPKIVQRSKGVPASASLHITASNCELLVVKAGKKYNLNDIDKPNLLKLLSSSDEGVTDDDVTKLQFQKLVLRLVLKFILLYGNLPCFKEIFDPIRITCKRCTIGYKHVGMSNTENSLGKLLSGVQSEIQQILKKRPVPNALVQVESNRPKALPLYEPRIEPVGEPFGKGNQKKLSASKREKDRLQHKFKREMKGAVREIKKDARFLAREKLQEQMEKDKERAAKVKRLFGFLSNQEGEVKKINRKKFKLDVS